MTEAVHSLPRLRGVLRLPAVSPAAAFAIRSGVAVSAAIWIGKAPGLVENHATWILITVLMLLQPTTGGSVLKGLLRAAGTLAAAPTSILLFGLFAQDPPLLMAGLFLVQAIAAYGNTGPRFQYAWFVWAFTTAIVLGDALAGQGAIETVAFQRVSMVLLGILLVVVVDTTLWPARAEPQLRQNLAARARQLGDELRRTLASAVASGGGETPVPASGALAGQLALVDAARSEVGVSRERADALARVAIALETLAARARVLAAPIETPAWWNAEGRALDAGLGDLARRVARALEQVAAALTASRAPASFAEELDETLLSLESERERLARRVDWSATLEGRAADVRELVAVLRAIETSFASSDAPSSKLRSGSLLQFRADPFRTRIALRTGLAVVAVIVATLALGWPLNTLVAPMAFMAAGYTRGMAVQTLAVFAGILSLGWIVADVMLVYVAPHVGRTPLALVPAFAVAATFGYIAARRPPLAALPAFGGLVVFLSVFGGTSAPTNVYGSYNTVCYMALALGTGWLFSRGMWPATSAGLFRQRVAAQLALCLDAVREARRAGDAGREERSTNLVRDCTQQAAQLGRLHGQARYEPVERALDQRRRARILALTLDLMDAVLSDRPDAAELLLARGGGRLRSLSDAIVREDEAILDSMQRARDTVRGEAAFRPSDLSAAHRALVERIEELRTQPEALRDLSDEDKQRIAIQLDSRRRLVFRQLAIEDWLADWRSAEGAADRGESQ